MKGPQTMNENREFFLYTLRYYMTEIMELYMSAYPDANYLSMSFFAQNGTMSVNNEYDGADSDFPISERFDGKEWYDYMKGEEE